MIMNLLLVKKMAIISNKKNPFAKDLFTKKYKSKIELYPWGTPTLVFGTPDII